MILFSKVLSIYQDRAKRETLYRLQNMSDRQLVDCGLSPELVKEGVKAWPWRTIPEQYAPLRLDSLSTDRNESEIVEQEPSMEQQDALSNLDAA